MNCKIHSDLNAVAACVWCKGFVCAACDVVVARKHYCKECLAGADKFSAESVPERAEIPVKKLTRSCDNRVIAGVCGGLATYTHLDPIGVRLIYVIATFFSIWLGIFGYLIAWMVIPNEKIANGGSGRNWLGLCITALGILVLGIGSIVLLGMSVAGSMISVITDSNLFKITHHFPLLAPIHLSIWLMAGAGLVILGLMFIARRFSLGWLVLAVMLIGAAGAAPQLSIISSNPTTVITSTLSGPLTVAQMALIDESLQPKKFIPTLPMDLQEQLNLLPLKGVSSVKVKALGNETHCEVEFTSGLDSRLHDSLSSHFENCFQNLIIEQVAVSGISILNLSISSKSGWSPFQVNVNQRGVLPEQMKQPIAVEKNDELGNEKEEF